MFAVPVLLPRRTEEAGDMAGSTPANARTPQAVQAPTFSPAAPAGDLPPEQERLRAVYQGAREYIGLLSPDGTVLDCNRASLAFVGESLEHVVGRKFWDTGWFAHTAGAPAAVRAAVGRAAAGEPVRLDITLQRPSAAPMCFDFSLNPVVDAEGTVTFIVPEGRDITELHRTTAALRASEARYRGLFDSIDEGLCVVQVLFDEQERPVDYRWLETNPAFVEQTGLVNAAGHTARELVPTLEEHWFETYGRVATTGEAIRFQNGSEPLGRWFDVFAFRIGDPAERKVAILFKDVTVAHRAERERERLLAALEVERSRLQEVFRQAPGFITAFRGPHHVYEFVNEAYYQLVGHREIIGKPLLEALPELRGQGFVDLLDAVVETGEPWVGRETPARLQRTPGGPPETRYLDMVFQALEEADGTRSGVVAHGFDVTAQVLARREVERLLTVSEQARRDAEAANRAKSEFLAVMSHELRTPLNAISGYADLLEMGIHGPITPAQRQALERIQLSQVHLLGLIDEVLNYAKLETATVHFAIEDFLAREALSTAESLLAPQARAKGLRLTVHGCPPDLTVRADSEKLRQILVNLLSNAVKFTDRSGTIDLRCASRRGRVLFEVADSGIGIPEDKIDTIFDPFVQVRADLTRPHQGTGLGLAISRELARGMEGTITVESAPGQGSVFRLDLPQG
jgi:PAS domain S-box-containing protein